MRLKLTCKSCCRNIEIEGECHVSAIECPNCGATINLPSNMLDIDSKLGGFTIIRHLGSGAMGCVYLAKQVSMDREVAIKVLPPEVKEHEEDLQNFLKEVRLLAKLDHPNIVTAFEAGEADGNYYMAMTYVQGETLEDKIIREGPLGEVDALNVVHKVAEALRYAWDKHQILHRDVKPENIMIDERNAEPKLLDMGISKALNEEPSNSSEHGILVGTPHYMSPEQAKAGSDIDFRSDMYSLGCSLFQFVTGRVPYDAANVMQVLGKHALDPVPSPLEYNSKLHSGTVELLRRVMAKRPDDRFESWDALLKQIRKTIYDIKHDKGKRIHINTVKSTRRKPISTDAELGLRAKDALARMHEDEFRDAPPANKLVKLLLILIIAMLVGATLIFAYVRTRTEKANVQLTDDETPSQVDTDVQNKIDAARRKLEEKRAAKKTEGQSKIDGLRKRFKTMVRTHRAKPESYYPLIDQCKRFSPQVKGTEIEADLAAHLNDLMSRQQSDAATVMKTLKQSAARQLRDRHYDAAVDIYKNYRGPCAPETVDERKKLIILLRKQQTRVLSSKEDANLFVEQAAHFMSTGAYAKAIALAEAERNKKSLDAALIQFVRDVASLDEVVLQSFHDQIGMEVSIYFRAKGKKVRTGKEKLKLSIIGIEGDEVKAFKKIKYGGGSGTMPRDFKVSEIYSSERIKRLASIKGDVFELMKGLVAFEFEKYSTAKSQFKKVKSPLAESLHVYAEIKGGDSEEQAEAQFQLLLDALNIKRTNRVEMNRELGRKTFIGAEKVKMKRTLDVFMLRFGKSRTARDNNSFLFQLMDMLGTVKKIDQVKADKFLTDIKKLNRLDRLVSKIEPIVGGVRLDLSKNAGLRRFIDLDPLQVRELSLSETTFQDLGRLNEFKLRSLDLSKTPIKSLKSFKNYSLVNLDLSQTKIRRLPDMRRYRLMTKLNVSSTPIESVASLADSGLEELDIRNCSRIQNLPTLRSLPNLKRLTLSPDIEGIWELNSLPKLELIGWSPDAMQPARSFWRDYAVKARQKVWETYNTQLRGILEAIAKQNNIIQPVDAVLSRCKYHPGGLEFNFDGIRSLKTISHLKGLPIVVLSICRTGIEDLSPLKGSPLKKLFADHSAISSLTALKACPLEVLDFSSTDADPAILANAWPNLVDLRFGTKSLSNLKMLKGKHLRTLHISGGRFNDLSPLSTHPLEYLSIENVPVGDLNPLAAIKTLRQLHMPRTEVTSLAPLKDLKLEAIDFSHCPASDFSPLKNCPLNDVVLNDSGVKNLDFLAGHQLSRLECMKTGVTDINMLSNMPITRLLIGETPILDFGAIGSLKRLKHLWVNDTSFHDIGLLAGKPLRELRLDGCTRIHSLRPMEGLKNLQRLTVPEMATDREVLMKLHKLMFVSSQFDGWRTRRDVFLK